MPELPEVETVKETLKTLVLNKQIKSVNIYYQNTIAYPKREEFIKEIYNQTIHDIKRRGKWLMFELDNYYLLSHLRMEGKYHLRTSTDEVNKHEHISFVFEDHTELRYQDTRKFGRMYLLDKENIYDSEPLKELGYEPWDTNLTPEYLHERYAKKKLPIKSVILDQNIIVGIGNIYADEILFLSKINPLKPASKHDKDELQAIIDNTRLVLDKAIKAGGTTIRSYTSNDGVHGRFQHELFVHSREGQACLECGTTIVKMKVGGRGTYYCPTCQILK
jgi:formamidopyrimidine-DNA glycosylase